MCCREICSAPTVARFPPQRKFVFSPGRGGAGLPSRGIRRRRVKAASPAAMAPVKRKRPPGTSRCMRVAALTEDVRALRSSITDANIETERPTILGDRIVTSPMTLVARSRFGRR